MAGIYIHIPFCASFCVYCDFYSVIRNDCRERFKDALLKEISLKADFFKGETPTTLYFGGGTPSLLPFSYLEEIMEKVRTLFSPSFEEITIEVNPDDLTKEYLLGLKKLGINRISMGVQSFDEDNLRWMNRRHNGKQAEEAYRLIRECGFENVSLDLIFGYTPLSFDVWERDIDKIISLSPEHVSAYQMTLEEGSMLAERGYREPPSEMCAEQYAMLQRKLHEGGYQQYEVSNFSKCGFRSKHNSAYWERKPYLGLGPAAHSFYGNERNWNLPDLEKYCSSMENGRPDLCSEGETLSEEEVAEEVLMLGLRKIEGVSLKPTKSLAEMAERGLIVLEGDNIRIPPDKMFISDYIIEMISA